MKYYGWKGYIPDLKAEKYAYRNIAKAVPVPDVSYGWSAPFRSQGDAPLCGPYSFCEVYYAECVRLGLNPVLLDPDDLADCYAWETGQPFDGVYNRIMLEVAAKYGVYSKEDGKRYYISAWHQINLADPDEIFNVLAEGKSFLAGFPVYKRAFEDAESGLTTMPDNNDEWLGGHDCSFHGYLKNPQNHLYGGQPVLIGQNHWDNWGFGPDNPPGFEGDAFGTKGNFLMPLEFLQRYGADAWTITIG